MQNTVFALKEENIMDVNSSKVFGLQCSQLNYFHGEFTRFEQTQIKTGYKT